jgi:glutamate/tyrosine decarboxylase-like PLP-dependent enzyme
MHYSWKKTISVLGLQKDALWPVGLDGQGRMDIAHLKSQIDMAERKKRPVLMVVSVVGTTELGTIDPVEEVCRVLDQHRRKTGVGVWHHVDGAYGGFFASLKGDPTLKKQTRRSLQALRRVDSIAIDPHKLGYVPYASGAFLTRNQRLYSLYDFDAPYIRFKKKSDRGLQTIEGSRSAAGAVATWMTLKCIGFDARGYGRILKITLRNRLNLFKLLQRKISNIRIIPVEDSNILCFCLAKKHEKLSEANRRTQRLYRALSPDKNGRFMVSRTVLGRGAYHRVFDKFIATWTGKADVDELVLIRLTLMNPFFGSKEAKVRFGDEFVKTIKDFAL